MSGSALPLRAGLQLSAPVASSKIGILAGGGRLPLLVAESVTARGGSVHIVGIEGEADREIGRFPHTWVNWGAIGRMTAALREEGGGELVIAGAVRRPDLWKLRPDAGFFRSLPQIVGLLAGGDDSVLSRVVRFFEGKGLTVRGAHEVAPDLLAQSGPLGSFPLSPQSRGQAELGFAVRAALGPLDAGQAVVVADGQVLAIEGAEGTDAMLERIIAMRRDAGRGKTGGVLAKGPKPGQELRVDMPAIGPRTLELAATAGLEGVAVEAGGVLVLGREETIRAADGRRLALEAMMSGPGSEATARKPAHLGVHVMGRLRPNRRDRADLATGLAAVERLAPFRTGSAAVVSRSYILAFAAGESALAMLERVRSLRQWGMRGTRRVGVLVCRADAAPDETALRELTEAAARQGLAGIAVAGAPAALDRYEMRATLADAQGLFLVACRFGDGR